MGIISIKIIVLVRFTTLLESMHSKFLNHSPIFNRSNVFFQFTRYLLILSAVVGRLTNNYIKFVTPPVPLVAGFENLLIKNPLPLFALVRPD